MRQKWDAAENSLITISHNFFFYPLSHREMTKVDTDVLQYCLTRKHLLVFPN